jgi:hypothetical protein
MLYTTTDKFLRVFGLSSLDDLPETELSPTAETTPEAMAVEEVGFTAGMSAMAEAVEESADAEQ